LSKQIDVPKLNDLEISLLLIERDVAQYRMERIDELINNIGEAQKLAETLEKEPKDTRRWNWNPNDIRWTDATGNKGSYEKSEDYNSLDHKALIKDLASHQGKLSREGFFYWLFENGSTIGRKKKQCQS
jgi:hypothetical protein